MDEKSNSAIYLELDVRSFLGFRANYLDVTREHVGAVSAVGNSLSSVAGMVAPHVVSGLIERFGSWTPVWVFIAAASVATALAFARFAAVTPVEDALSRP